MATTSKEGSRRVNCPPRAPRAEVTTSHVEAAPVAVDTTPAAPVTEGGAQ